ncbi:TaqI family restriction endonuclease [Hydrogenivirga sp. 128-5-R1-1]|uniref:TaqI family restriction endonuclease n=1 Tax=Hydrogenivirga sp. 128-5-R1-1 TaxID=392423 RepID=UPI00015F1982|nr:TaqI family restriction endonuclease [Hydrogenivirga sp. 128-5-R1-1]EDP73315.1 hypothetical protein HG1285_09116 [Hydrogenivirga sp. 128-5-R1-1]
MPLEFFYLNFSLELETKVVELNKVKIAIQVKKVSYRREASDRIFTKRQQKYANIVVEIPYLVINVDELKNKIANPRVRKSAKVKYQNALDVFNKNFIKLDNGFVIFREEYLRYVREVILQKLNTTKKISYEEILIW